MKNKVDTSDDWFLYRRRGKTLIDQMTNFVIVGFLLLICFLMARDRIQYDWESNSQMAPSVIFYVILFAMILIVTIVLFPVGYGRMTITRTQIRIIPPAYLDFLPFKETFDLDRKIVIRYHSRNYLLEFKTGNNRRYLRLNGVKDSRIEDILMKIKQLSMTNRNVRFYRQGNKQKE